MGSLGQFVFAPLGQAFIGAYGAATALVLVAGCVAFVPFLAIALAGGEAMDEGPHGSTLGAVRDALRHPSYVLLTCGFFVCGFHIAFVTTHLPPYLSDLGMSHGLAALAIGLIGLFNVIGAYSSGVLGGIYSRRLLLSGIYASRAGAFALFVLLPATPLTVLVFAALIGLLWLSTVAPTSGLIAVMFGTRHLGVLFGIVFLSHQVGAFLGVWLGGLVYDATGTYDLMWWLSIALGLAAAIVHLPIQERRAPAIATA
jgi:predicted MFS family arabinose efflux permease